MKNSGSDVCLIRLQHNDEDQHFAFCMFKILNKVHGIIPKGTNKFKIKHFFF